MQPDSDVAKRALRDVKFASFWLDTLPAIDDQPALSHDIQCDLLIVGGGFCGLWAAVSAKQADPDRDVVLIEAKSIANGASGRPAAIMSTSVMHGIINTERNFPDEIDQLEALGQANIDAFRSTLERYQVACDLEWGGELTVAVGDHGIPIIERTHQLYQRYGHEAEILDEQAVKAQINSPIFSAGVWLKRRSGTVDPGKLARGLKELVLSLGVRVFENTPQVGNTFRAGKVDVFTTQAKIQARKVLLATNAWAAGHATINRRVMAIRDRIVVTEPLTKDQLREIGWQHRQGIYDTRTQLNYMRLTKDNRILYGGRLDYFYGNNTDPQADKTAEPYLRLVNSFYRTFPMLKGQIEFSHAWSGPIGLTARMAVHYQRFHTGNMVYAGGYSGFGVTATRFGARVGLAILDDEDIPETRMTFARTVPALIPPEPFRWIGSKLTMYALDTLDEKGGWRKPWVSLIEKMGFPITS